MHHNFSFEKLMEVFFFLSVPGHKINLSKFQWIYIIQSMFSDYSRIKLKINNKKKARKI